MNGALTQVEWTSWAATGCKKMYKYMRILADRGLRSFDSEPLLALAIICSVSNAC